MFVSTSYVLCGTPVQLMDVVCILPKLPVVDSRTIFRPCLGSCLSCVTRTPVCIGLSIRAYACTVAACIALAN